MQASVETRRALQRNLTREARRLEVLARKLEVPRRAMRDLDSAALERSLLELVPLIQEGERLRAERGSLTAELVMDGRKAGAITIDALGDPALSQLARTVRPLGERVSREVRAMFLLGRFSSRAVDGALATLCGETVLSSRRDGLLLDQEA